jgi:formylglycine-generating enzyme required for sulfatase activity
VNPSPLLIGLLLAQTPATQPPAAQSAPDAPPCAVLVPGGRTRIGIDVKDVERLIENDPTAPPFAGALIGETPHQDMVVDPFWMMVTEVTQEQYGEFVRATGAAPLEPWCENAIAAAAREFVVAEQRREDDARAKGTSVPTRRTFDAHAWFQANAKHLEWAIPPTDRARPAVFVDYDSARAFARWAGMRLPTEFEYERAVRGDTNQTYPWGSDWDNDKYAATSLLKKKGGTWPVGSFPAGRSKQGVHDLAGNAWEWTSSPYVGYPGYQQKIFELGFGSQKHAVNAIADWNADQRVVVGGSFQTSNLMARATTRRGATRDQMAGALGFRCAASVRPGADMAHCVIDDDFDVQLRPRVDGAIVEYAPEMALCADAWMTSTAPPQEGWTPPDHYAVVTDYRYVLFAPIAQVPAADIGAFERRSLEDPVPLGLLSANVALLDPNLPAGTYRLAYRAHGVRRLGEGRPSAAEHFGEAPLEEVLHLDVSVDHVIVSDLRGRPLVAIPLHVDYGLEREGRVESSEETTTGEASDGAPRIRHVRMEAALPCRTTKKCFLFALDLRVEAGDARLAWRR